MNFIYKSWENKQACLVILTDLPKAFSTLDHAILLYKLGIYGIHGPALSWVADYLSGRTQRTKIGKSLSESLTIKCVFPHTWTLILYHMLQQYH